MSPSLPLRALAPAKINLGLFVGPVREDGRHELVTVMQSISLADELVLELASVGGRDEVVCPGVPGGPAENLAARALAAFRAATGWDAPPLRLTIDKRIPVAAGLGGGSADAAAALRLAAAASGLGEDGLLLEIAGELGADVPAQVSPGRWLATGAGEVLEALPDPSHSLGVLVLPAAEGLSTAEVYAVADRFAGARTEGELAERRGALGRAFELGMPLPADPGLLGNDLEGAAIALSPRSPRRSPRPGTPGPRSRCSAGPGRPSSGSSPGPTGRPGPSAASPPWPDARPRPSPRFRSGPASGMSSASR